MNAGYIPSNHWVHDEKIEEEELLEKLVII